MAGKAKHILLELKGHLPFTAAGTLLGIIFMLVFLKAPEKTVNILFSFFHPAHVLLSAIVTASIFKIHAKGKSFVIILLIGYFGSIGIAKLSDIVVPYVGVNLLNLDSAMLKHDHSHEQDADHEADAAATLEHSDEHADNAEIHHDEDAEHHEHKSLSQFLFGDFFIVTPAALLGILIAFYMPHTKFPHFGHVLISTWASSAFLLSQIQGQMSIGSAVEIFVVLFLAVWIPCCLSDIVFPLLFVKGDVKIHGTCCNHKLHSHPHKHDDNGDTQ